MLDLLNPLEIFSEETPVETTFRFGATGLGKTLDAGSSEDDVQPGASVEAPLWLVRPLVGRSMASIKLPAIYGERYQRKLNAGADCVSLKNMVSAANAHSASLGLDSKPEPKAADFFKSQITKCVVHTPLACPANKECPQSHFICHV
eukprot:1158099-Pelagomonas_calceolata.AAC.2